jgi:hypothetical protein
MKKEKVDSTETRKWPEITPEIIEEAKGKSFGMPVFSTDYAGQSYIFRALASHEWKELIKQGAGLDDKDPISITKQHELICNKSVLWPAIQEVPVDNLGRGFWDMTLAGMAESLVVQIRKRSGFPALQEDGSVKGAKLECVSGPILLDIPEPTAEELEQLREVSPNKSVYKVDFGPEGGTHYFRPLLRSEWAAAQMEDQKGKDSYDFVVRACLLWSNYPWKDKPSLSGVVEQLFNFILEQSGFDWSCESIEL